MQLTYARYAAYTEMFDKRKPYASKTNKLRKKMRGMFLHTISRNAVSHENLSFKQKTQNNVLREHMYHGEFNMRTAAARPEDRNANARTATLAQDFGALRRTGPTAPASKHLPSKAQKVDFPCSKRMANA